MQAEQPSAFPPGLVIYQIYPRSFMDSNGDGVGDVAGIISKLDYLAGLGITALWLCPIYPSPQADFGYDVSDYTNIDPLYGSLAELDELIKQAHGRGIKIILDLVLNHTSEQHAWFKESRQSLDNPKRDWYVWKAPNAAGGPPNNWLSSFGGSAWEMDPATNQYYLHSFFKQQPDLNWQNPDVRQALKQVMQFWLARGVDGFRLDAVYWYAKDPAYRDEPSNPVFRAETNSPYDALKHIYSKGDVKLYGYLNEMAELLAGYHDRFMVMEVYPDDPMDVPSYRRFYDQVNPLVAAPFNFGILSLPWGARQFRTFIDDFQKSLRPGDTPVYVSGNHDRPRLASRVGRRATPASALLQLTLPGAAVIYYGEELGMKSVPIANVDVRDELQGRDPERTPMQWSPQPHAGFSSAKPWLPVADNYDQQNVEVEARDPASLLNFYMQLIHLRRTSDVLRQGSYIPLVTNNLNLFAFRRQAGDHNLIIIVNFSRTETTPLVLPGRIILSTTPNPAATELKPLEGRIVEA